MRFVSFFLFYRFLVDVADVALRNAFLSVLSQRSSVTGLACCEIVQLQLLTDTLSGRVCRMSRSLTAPVLPKAQGAVF